MINFFRQRPWKLSAASSTITNRSTSGLNGFSSPGPSVTPRTIRSHRLAWIRDDPMPDPFAKAAKLQRWGLRTGTKTAVHHSSKPESRLASYLDGFCAGSPWISAPFARHPCRPCRIADPAMAQ
eukprot:4849504-Amphidinium_carterae.1